MPKIKKSAIKDWDTGEIYSEPSPANHGKIARKHGASGKHGFVTDGGEFVDRQQAKKIANKSGQATVKGKRGLHSRDVY